MGDILISAFAFVLRERITARAPGHHASIGREPALLVATGEEAPDGFDIGIVVPEVGAFPVHPQAQALGLGRDDAGKLFDARAPRARKSPCRGREYRIWCEKPGYFDFNFGGQPGSIEAVLPAQAAPVKGRESGRKYLYPSGS